MKKLILLACCLTCLFSVASCKEDDAEHTHDYTSTVIAPTCTADGYTLHECAGCGHQYTDQTVHASGHSYEETLLDAACNQMQKKLFKCKACGDYYKEELAVPGTVHSYQVTVTYPDRENGGYTTHQCKNCSSSYVDHYTDPVDFSTGLAYTIEDGKYYVSGMGTCKDTEVIVPAISEQGYPVAGIIINAFSGTNVTSIVVSDGVKEIRTGAFYDCAALQSVTLPKSANVAENLFRGNVSLTTLTMAMEKPIAYYFTNVNTAPEGHMLLVQGNGSVLSTYYGAIPLSLREINLLNAPGAMVLVGCNMITKVSMPADATSIGASAFKNCSALEHITIPEGVKSIGAYAFAKTAIRSIVIPEGVRFSIGDHYMFEGCTQLSEVQFLAKTTCLPSYFFLNCSSLSEITLPDTISAFGASVVAGTAIENITIPDGVTAIEMNAFNGCNKLKTVVLPSKLKKIGYCAFQYCTSLRQINLPQSLERIDHDAFNGCTALESMTLPANLQELSYGVFQGCTALKQVEMPAKLQRIEQNLFFGCTSLTVITLPETVERIGISAFEGSGIISVVIPAGVTTVAMRAFANCAALTTVTFLSDATPLSNEMFLGATSLKEIEIPKNVNRIPNRFCQGATSLKKIVFPDGLLVIGEESFSGCTAIESITVPKGLEAIENKAFMGCTSLKSVDLSGAKLNPMTGSWFADCTSLTEVKNHDGLTKMNKSIFKNTPIQTVVHGMTIALGWLIEADPKATPSVLTIPQGVTKICDYAFSACAHLTEVTIPEGVVSLGLRIFGENDGPHLTKLILPDSLTNLSTSTVSLLPGIEELEIGKGLQTIEGNGFGKLKTIRFRGTLAELKQMPWFAKLDLEKITVICTDGNVGATVA